MKFQAGNNIAYGHDFSYYTGLPTDVDFVVTKKGELFELRAPGYGGEPYGNGCLTVNKEGISQEMCGVLEKACGISMTTTMPDSVTVENYNSEALRTLAQELLKVADKLDQGTMAYHTGGMIVETINDKGTSFDKATHLHGDIIFKQMAVPLHKAADHDAKHWTPVDLLRFALQQDEVTSAKRVVLLYSNEDPMLVNRIGAGVTINDVVCICELAKLRANAQLICQELNDK